MVNTGCMRPSTGKLMVLDRIFVKITGGSMWSPDMKYFEVSGCDPATGKAVAERKKVLERVRSKLIMAIKTLLR